ncbi:MAG: hypothetical protein JWO31_3835 [Phycisphaerales bacterium]|nr:hypothetical protein [Phycisphaerales bacterium]
MAFKHETQQAATDVRRPATPAPKAYHPDAYEFVQEGLCHTVREVYGDGPVSAAQHVSGQQLCHGLRAFAHARWGLLAGAVLGRWNVTATLDFGRLVFAMIDAGQLHRTPHDTLEDFRDVFDFRAGFEHGYRVAVDAFG